MLIKGLIQSETRELAGLARDQKLAPEQMEEVPYH